MICNQNCDCEEIDREIKEKEYEFTENILGVFQAFKSDSMNLFKSF